MTTTKPATEVPDGTMLPFAMDMNKIWHKRPADDTWGGSEGGNLCATVCGEQIASTEFANTDPRQAVLVESKLTCIGCFPVADKAAKDHDELRDKRTYLLNIRGILSPQDRSPGLGPVVPMPLGKEVAPAVEWLVNEVDQLREENLHLHGIKSAPDVWGDALPLTDNERAFQDGV